MKYIRTKDELGVLIEPTDNEELQKLKVGVNDMIFSTWYGNDRDHIIKQADTIEELCDLFVLENEIKDEEPFSIMEKKLFNLFAKTISETILITKQKFYGAIWTDKGLIYVAKMNDKGELELL